MTKQEFDKAFAEAAAMGGAAKMVALGRIRQQLNRDLAESLSLAPRAPWVYGAEDYDREYVAAMEAYERR